MSKSCCCSAKNCTKKRDTRELLLTKPIAFLPFSLPSPSSQRRLDCGDFKGFRRFRLSLLFSSSIKKTKGSSAHRVASILIWAGRPTIRSLVHSKATRNMPFHGIEVLKPVILLTRIKIHHHRTLCGWLPVSALTEKNIFLIYSCTKLKIHHHIPDIA